MHRGMEARESSRRESQVAGSRKARHEIELIRRSGLFDHAWYCSTYGDVMQTSLSPVEHFYRYGGWLGRDPGPGFSTRDYLERHSDVRESSINPLVHFLVHGKAEGRSITSSADGIDSTVCADPDSWPTMHSRFAGRRGVGRYRGPSTA